MFCESIIVSIILGTIIFFWKHHLKRNQYWRSFFSLWLCSWEYLPPLTGSTSACFIHIFPATRPLHFDVLCTVQSFLSSFFSLIISNQPDAPGRWASTWDYNKKNLKLARISQFLRDKTQFSLINFRTCIFPDLGKLTILLDFFLKCSNHITEYLWYSFITTKVEASVPFSVIETTDSTSCYHLLLLPSENFYRLSGNIYYTC